MVKVWNEANELNVVKVWNVADVLNVVNVWNVMKVWNVVNVLKLVTLIAWATFIQRRMYDRLWENSK